MTTLRAVTYLAPGMRPVYARLLAYAGDQLGVQITLDVGDDYAAVFDYDLALICGLPYVLRTPPCTDSARLEALAAPVLTDPRCAGRPVYFSDVIVRRDSPFQTLADLRGGRWAYNELESQSGYGIVCYILVERGLTRDFFSEMIAAGFHDRAIQLVRAGEIDAAAIDWQVLALAQRADPTLADDLRVIDTFGPSTIQPLAATDRVDAALKDDLRAVFAELHTVPALASWLAQGFVARWVPVHDADYDDIRAMWAAVIAAGF